MWNVSSFTLGTTPILDRVVSASDTLVYSILHAQKVDTNWAEFCGKSANRGLTWNWTEIGEIEAPTAGGFNSARNYHSWTYGSHDAIATNGLITMDMWWSRYSCYYYESCMLECVLTIPVTSASNITFSYDVVGDLLSLGTNSNGDNPPLVHNGNSTITATITETTPTENGYHIEGYFSPGTLTHFDFGYDSSNKAQWTCYVDSGHRICQVINFEINGVSYVTSSVSRAFDVSRTNNNWLYYGATDKIWASEDGGMTWFTFYDVYGAYDVLVDPQLAGAIYHWSATGFLNLLVKETLGAAGVLQNTGLISESPALNLPLRIARDTNSGKLWACPNGTKIVMRDLGSTADQQTGLTECTGLHAYTGGYLIAVDATKVWVSNDYGTTWVDKTGSWGTYGNGNNAHRIKS